MFFMDATSATRSNASSSNGALEAVSATDIRARLIPQGGGFIASPKAAVDGEPVCAGVIVRGSLT